MKTTTITCDRCAKTLPDTRPVTRISSFCNEDLAADLCDECAAEYRKVLKLFIKAKSEKETSTPSEQDADQKDEAAEKPSKHEILKWMLNWAKRVMTDPRDLTAISKPTPIEYSILPEMIVKIGELNRSVKKDRPEA